MYLTTFKLKEAPFQADADPRFLYLSQGHARARAYMESALGDGEPFVAISGADGTGKSVLAAAFRNELGKEILALRCAGPQPSGREFLQSLLDQCGFLPFRGDKPALLDTLEKHLAEQHAAGRKALLFLDDAHDAGPPVFEALLDLANPQAGGAGPLRTILLGRPGLAQQLDSPQLAALAQRLRLQLELGALTAEQTRGYIVHRLAIAGSQGREVFDALAIDAIHRHAGGVPRRVNLLCDAALQAAAVGGHETVSVADVREAARQLQWPEATGSGNSGVYARATGAPAAAGAPGAAGATSAAGASARHLAAQQGPGAGASPVARLRVQSAGQLIAEQDLYLGRMMIGRAADADLRIDDRTISRHHCQVICTDEHSVIQDLNSTNGIYVDERRVRRHLLRDGEAFLLGAYQVIYSDLRSTAATGQHAVPPAAEFSESEGESTQP